MNLPQSLQKLVMTIAQTGPDVTKCNHGTSASCKQKFKQ